jgi:outer membrane lipoprotein
MRAMFPLFLLLLSACATVPEPLSGEFPASMPESGVATSTRVRWGGNVIAVEPKATETCFQVLARELSERARPRLSDASGGRFVACRGGFYDPAVFAQGREVTVVGSVTGTTVLRIGEHELSVPRVAADVVYLWPERQEQVIYRHDPFWWYSPWHDPFWTRPYYVRYRHVRPHEVPKAPAAPPTGGP